MKVVAMRIVVSLTVPSLTIRESILMILLMMSKSMSNDSMIMGLDRILLFHFSDFLSELHLPSDCLMMMMMMVPMMIIH